MFYKIYFCFLYLFFYVLFVFLFMGSLWNFGSKIAPNLSAFIFTGLCKVGASQRLLTEIKSMKTANQITYLQVHSANLS